MKKYEVTQRQLSVSSPTEKVRSRHSSGQSVSSLRAMRTNSQEGLKKRPVVTPTDSPVNQPRHQREEAWHIELRHTFLKQYIKYVQSLGFVLVSLQPNLHAKGTHKRRSSYEKLTVHAEDHPSTPPPPSGAPHSQSSTCYLHKAMPAGILLLKLSFREQYFCVEMYVCENTRLGIPVNKHLKLLFVDECEKCKDIIHVHSFAHDFHLRCIQSCIQPDQSSPSFFRPQYHLTGFLRDFMQVYPYPPKFSRNFLSEDTVSISNLSTNGSDLYNFMVQNNKLIELKKFEMIPSVDPEIENDFFFVRSTEFALVSQKTESITLPPKGNKPQCENYFVGLVITHNPNTDTDRQTLKLNYFIVLTSQAELFPTDPVESKSGEFKAMVLQELSDRTKVVPVKQHISVRKAVQKFQKISKIHNLPLYKLLENERDLARQKIDDMIERSEVKCRKDSLWQRMLIGGKLEEKDNLQKLEFEEFLELLGMSVQMSLDSIDAKLIPFLNMNFLWYSGLFKKLQAKYPDTHRCFTSSDGLVQYIVILNPNYLDMFSMLMTNAKDNRTFLGAVYRDSLYDQVDTEECPNLPVRSVNLHLEEFVNVCSFHLWSSML